MGKLIRSIGEFFTGGTKTPTISLPPPPAPKPPPEPVKSARDRAAGVREEVRRRAALLGARATNPTGALGLPGAAPTAKKQLLGQ